MSKTIIKFLKCSNDEWWYKDKVGQTFEVKEGIEINEDKDNFILKGRILNSLIKKTDVELTHESKN